MSKTADSKDAAVAAKPDAGWSNYVEDFRRAGHETVDWIAGYLNSVAEMPVLARTRPGELLDALPESAPEHGEPFTAILRDFDRLIMPAVTQWNHPRFFAYFACTGSTPAVLGEMLAAALNTNGLHWKTSPAVAELEQRALDWLRQWIGLPEGWFGIVYDTASTSSMHAIVCAREMVAPEARRHGSRGDLVVYTSEQSHSSIEKGAIAVGIGQDNVRKVATDSNFAMRADSLAKMIEDDKASGKRPACIVATIGTTSSTAIDPLAKIVEIAENHNIWVHVDAAYAGAAAMLPEHRNILAGVERAHSLVFNAHKWLLTPIDLSAFYTRRPDILRRAFSLTPDYLKTQDDPRAHNLMDYGVPLGHRFRALKLWFVMRYFGRERVEAILRSHIEWAQKFAALVDAHPQFERIAPVPFSVVCFRFQGSDLENHAIQEKVNASGRVFISGTVLNGKFVLRLAIGNLATQWQDVQEAWELIVKAAAEVGPA
ncbi:MAG TPA: aminotransferase class I/II-fold pyridoxal phosphate-dependent enzyme [Candidatus Angelobacter sp.]|nr:aminotransferase class I/II-fold pyridoxal phosphate-dependent enzyme [Candidatus Angelobacter sp.]